MNYAISVLLANQYGALTRVSGLFARRGYNIESLSVGITDDPNVSRITIVVDGDQPLLDQISKQLLKLEDVRKVELLERDASAFRELCLLKVSADMTTRSSVIEATHVFRAKIIDFCPESIIIEMTGDSGKIEAFVELMRPHGILEMARTGIAGLARGGGSIYDSKIEEEEI